MKIALISGGSSGIGLSCAHWLAQRNYHVILLARDLRRLERAELNLRQAGHAAVEAHALDVCDAQACAVLIAAILRKHGRIDWLITSAGMVEPGMFLDLALASHRQQMETNFFGTLHLVQPIAAHMRNQGGGRITLIASAAAFAGVAGYSGYAPGKFAVRGLGEVLRVELAPFGIAVGVAFPPDTDTPQLAQENLLKPEATRQITAGGGVWPVDVIAARLLSQAEAGVFMIAPTRLIWAFGWLHSLYAPLFRWHQARILRNVSKSRTGILVRLAQFLGVNKDEIGKGNHKAEAKQAHRDITP